MPLELAKRDKVGVAVETPVALAAASSALFVVIGKDNKVIDIAKGSACTVPVTATFASTAPELALITLPENVPTVELLSRTPTVLLEIVPETGEILRGPADHVAPPSVEI